MRRLATARAELTLNLNSKKMGASGKVIFRFRPLSRGDYAIRFALMRPWEDEVAEHLEVSLHVD